MDYNPASQGPIPAFDTTPTILAQYANSPTIQALLNDFVAWLDPAADLNLFFSYVWNLQTAQGFGLDIWGRILGVNRIFPVIPLAYFGYKESTSAYTFGEGTFWTGAVVTNNYALSDTSYRQVLFAKALSNITNGSIQGINLLLMNLFAGRGNAYVVDNANMTMQYYFNFAWSPVDATIVMNSGVLPSPNGVSLSYFHL